MRTDRRKGRSAFTLLEVLLVITILGILAAFVVPRLMGVSEQAKIDIARSAVGKGGSIATQLDIFHLRIGRYPTSNEGLAALHDPDALSDEEESKRWIKLIKDPEMLKDPWGRPYEYKGPEDAQFNKDEYDLWSEGPDPNNDEDNIGNWTKER